MNRLKKFILRYGADSKLLWTMAINDLRAKFAGSLLGVLWAFINQFVILAMFYFVFSVGFRASPVEDFPYFLWLACGMVPWFFFQEAWPRATDSISEYSYLVKRTAFHADYLPIVRILSAFIVHVVFLALLVIVFILNGFPPSLYWIQLLYYIFCNVALIGSLSLITSSIVVFYRDVSQFIAVFMSVLFWMTPLCWTPPRPLIVYNPVSYVVGGFRDSMVFNTWFWQKPYETTVFWITVVFLSACGVFCFRRLRPHFAEVL